MNFDPHSVEVSVRNGTAEVLVRFRALGVDEVVSDRYLNELLTEVRRFDKTSAKGNTANFKVSFAAQNIVFDATRYPGKHAVKPLVDRLIGGVEKAIAWPKEKCRHERCSMRADMSEGHCLDCGEKVI